MVKDKIKALFKMFNKSVGDGANALNMPYHSFANKLNQRGFKTEELITLGEMTGTQLAFIDKEGKPIITFDMNDLSNSK